ncbi:antibiotic biosynthesis monooxygenase [Flavobacterium sp. MAH-1]|uniref:Antibiotic biosynthesis monooxygenase n=1 Tax=Flavobacterium agri TaxID=2743471 RepID=A0A7Y9C654_9FLAO|nr:antibiotic biosynthesis monooxygenase [Flavobacterium agri]NUY81661.1 antibiotic biosynthesis monooxygenase [Flavobacterium agri]NYA71685.1 antibiotic biosynthesis monooxygenase [Flavobacterium agri]
MKATTSVLKKAVLFFAVFLFMENQGKAQHQDNMKKKILFVVTSHDKKGETGEPTGFYLSEVSHPWEILANAGYEIDFVSPKGGKAPVDGFNLSDETNRKFWEDARYKSKIENTLKPSQINPNDYIAIHYAGGHGAMWDFADNKQLANIAAKIYENGGIVSAVCHGPAGLVNIKLSNGKYLVDGKKINAFTNEEEVAVKLDKVVPFLLESKLIERGAIFEKSGLWQAHVVADKRVVTGQNPQSAKMIGESVLQQLENLDMVAKMSQFEVKTTDDQKFRKVISEYVQSALSREGNVMAEAYYEKDKPSVLWLIERWKNKSEYADFVKTTEAKALKSLQKNAFSKNYNLSDLEPLSKSQWRKTTTKTDEQLTIMLFVDAKKGTEQKFKDTYHIAMPQFRSEPGVVTYQLSQVEGDGTLFVTFEKFRSQAAFQYHLDFPPIKPVIEYLETSIKKPPFQNGLHTLIEFAPLTRE